MFIFTVLIHHHRRKFRHRYLLLSLQCHQPLSQVRRHRYTPVHHLAQCRPQYQRQALALCHQHFLLLAHHKVQRYQPVILPRCQLALPQVFLPMFAPVFSLTLLMLMLSTECINSRMNFLTIIADGLILIIWVKYIGQKVLFLHITGLYLQMVSMLRQRTSMEGGDTRRLLVKKYGPYLGMQTLLGEQSTGLL